MPSLDLLVGASSLGPEGHLLVEEGSLAMVPSLRRKGNLYLLAHGASGQAPRFAKSLRDQYYGDPSIIDPSHVPLGLLDSIAAAAAHLGEGPGVSFICAVAYDPNRLALVGVGDCRGFIARGKGGLEALVAPRYTGQKLGQGRQAPLERVQRSLSYGDSVILCCGPIAQSWGANQVSTLASAAGGDSFQALADRLMAREEGSGGAALVLMCSERAAFSRGEEASLVGPSQEESQWSWASRERKGLPWAGASGSSLRRALRWGLAAFVAVTVGSATLDTAREYLPPPFVSLPATPSPSSTAPPPPTAELWARVDALWPLGEKGEMEAWREIVVLLERLRGGNPGDAGVISKLRAADFNLAYAEMMREVAVFWGTGETSARTVESWQKAVALLEDLHQRMLKVGYVKALVDKLYAARVNYGKALEAAGRPAEARASYEKARELDPSRPEALDALKRFR